MRGELRLALYLLGGLAVHAGALRARLRGYRGFGRTGLFGRGSCPDLLDDEPDGVAVGGFHDFLKTVLDPNENGGSADDCAPLIHTGTLGPDAVLAVPTPEHYLPLLYILGTRRAGDAITFPVEGVDGGSISMLAVQVG